MNERPDEPQSPVDAESLLPIDEHIEEGHDAEGRKVRHRGIYLLPNLFTTANLFAGFYAIINAMNGNFYVSAAAVFVAMVLDGLDGRVARLTNTQSAFGAEYDSLSDMVAFGVAPALLAFEWALGSMGKVGWMVAFIYVAGAALRLARFNTQICMFVIARQHTCVYLTSLDICVRTYNTYACTYTRTHACTYTYTPVP